MVVINQNPLSDWLPSGQDDAILPSWDYLLCPARIRCSLCHVTN